jgi:Tol biopolymer transport system component
MLVACTTVLGGLCALPAAATAPGKNGEITFRRFVGPDAIPTIFTIRADGSGERQVTTPPEGAGDDFPDYASDGSFIAFERCSILCQVMAVRPDGSGLREVGTPCRGPRADDFVSRRCSDNVDVGIAPDTRRVAFSRAWGHIVDDQIDHVAIFVRRLDGGRARQVTFPPERGAEDSQVQWSPDGRRLVFTRKFWDGHGGYLKQALYTVRTDGRDLRRITPFALQAGDWPDWSPDGKRILFRSPDSEDFLNTNLFTIRPDGTGLRQVTHAAPDTTVFSASFSPDGKRITAGLQGVGGAADIYTMKTDGTDVQPVTRTPERDSAPDWGGKR